jgi:hypothetical protein
MFSAIIEPSRKDQNRNVWEHLDGISGRLRNRALGFCFLIDFRPFVDQRSIGTTLNLIDLARTTRPKGWVLQEL